ncbi:MAG: YbdD/YjiX family protein [bacterium]
MMKRAGVDHAMMNRADAEICHPERSEGPAPFIAEHAGGGFRTQLERAARVVRRIIGAPDYELYLVHQRQCHPDLAPLTKPEFARDVLARRYEKPGSRCC